MKIIKDGKIINATQKAYEVIYKSDGYKIYDEDDTSQDMEEGFELIYDDITREDIMKMLDKKGIEYNERDVKQDLYDLLRGDSDEADK